MNEDSDILSCQFTKGTSIDNVRGLLCALNTRLTSDEERIHGIMVDNCCSVRAKLRWRLLFYFCWLCNRKVL